MNKQCKFQVGKYNCGSYAFNLYKEQIDQKDRCDLHYWQERANRAALHEREACARLMFILDLGGFEEKAANEIRARGET
jgi:hypothetical protein